MTTGTTRGGFGGSRELGKYRLVNELAKSQLGALWAGMSGDTKEGEEAQLVLVRRFDTSVIENTDQVDNLSEAAWWAMELSKDQIARTLDVVKTENELGMIYAYTEGEVFRALLRLATFKRKPFAVPVALRVALDVLEAVASTRDQAAEDHIELACGGLSPDSVFVGTDGMTRLLDVGAGGVLCGAQRVLSNPEMAAYAAPEQLEEEPKPSPRSDVFSGGILLWEMLLGKRLFVGSNFAAVSAKVKEAKVPRLDDAKPAGGEAIPGEVADLVARALSADPEERFADCREFIAAIEALSVEPAERSAVGEMVDALDGNALATRRKVIDRARGVKSPATKPLAARAPSPIAAPPKPAAPAPPPKPTSSPTAAAAPPKPPAPPPKPGGGGRPPPPPRARMETMDSELLEDAADSEAPESAGVDVDVDLEAPGVPSDLAAKEEEKGEKAEAAGEAGKTEASDEAEKTETSGEAEESGKAETSGETKSEDGEKEGDEAKALPADIPPPPPELGDGSLPPAPGVSEGALIAELIKDSTRPGPPGDDADAAESSDKKSKKEAEAADAAASGPEASSSPAAASSPEASSSPEAATLDASDEGTSAELAAVDERTRRARRMVTMVIGGLAVLLLVGLGVSKLGGHKTPTPDSSAAAPPASATAPAATASETAEAPSASAPSEATEAGAGTENAGDAGAEDAATEAAAEAEAPEPSASAEKKATPPPVQHRPAVQHHYKPRPRPKHKYTPSGI